MQGSTSFDLQSELNAAQRDVVSSLEGPHLVVAGAGTGKTRVLVYRAANLVDSGVAPESILLLTFTRRAAREMLDRAARLLDDRCRRISGGTYHAFANLVLRHSADRLEFNQNFTILDRPDAVDLLGVVRAESGFAARRRRFPRADTLVDLFSKAINTNTSLTKTIAAHAPRFEKDVDEIRSVRDRFRERKLADNVMDYDDLLVHLRDLLASDHDFRARLARRYRYLMVDEYQDTNRLQAQIGALLAASHRNLMVVGDEAQSVYSFRGASFRNIMDFPLIFPDARVLKLETNYRSDQPILDLGNALLATAEETFDKRLVSNRSGGSKPQLVRCPDEREQAVYIADQLLTRREEGIPLSEMAVLFRAAWHSNVLELELAKRNIPFKKYGGIRFAESAHIKDVLALLKLSVNPLDSGSSFRSLQLCEGIGPKIAFRLYDAVRKHGGNWQDIDPTQVAPRSREDLVKLLGLLGELAVEQRASNRLELVLDTYSPWLRQRFDDAERRAQDFESLGVLAQPYEKTERFLADLAIEPPDFRRSEASSSDEDETVTLSTIHSAKGLEWHDVYVIHLNEGRFPSYASIGKTDQIEEEKRLLYVAITRSRRRLTLLKPEEIGGSGPGFEVGELTSLLSSIPDLESLVSSLSTTNSSQADDSLPRQQAIISSHDDEQLRRIEDYFSNQ